MIIDEPDRLIFFFQHIYVRRFKPTLRYRQRLQIAAIEPFRNLQRLDFCEPVQPRDFAILDEAIVIFSRAPKIFIVADTTNSGVKAIIHYSLGVNTCYVSAVRRNVNGTKRFVLITVSVNFLVITQPIPMLHGTKINTINAKDCIIWYKNEWALKFGFCRLKAKPQPSSAGVLRNDPL